VKWTIGVVVYTGFDTKIMKNFDKSRFKRSKVLSNTN